MFETLKFIAETVRLVFRTWLLIRMALVWINDRPMPESWLRDTMFLMVLSI